MKYYITFSMGLLLLLLFSTASASYSENFLKSAAVAQTNITKEEYSRFKSVAALPTLWFFTHPIAFYYVSMGSEHMYRSYAEILLGHPATRTELKHMNLRVRFYFGVPDYKVVTEADSVDETGQRVINVMKQNCRPEAFQLDTRLTGLSRALCVPTAGSLGVRPNLIAKSYEKIVWGSQKDQAVLITRYINDAVIDWKILSLDKRLSPETERKVLQKVKSLNLAL